MNDVSGTLRLRRTGTIIEGYFWDGAQSVLLGSSTTSTGDTAFVIDFSGGSGSPVTPPGNVAIAFDNFKIRFDAIGQRLAEARDDSSGVRHGRRTDRPLARAGARSK